MVNMDGRMYDPVLGRFMTPDPFVQMPDFTQSLNRYSYCMNNPLSLTDTTGYSWLGDTFAAVVGIAVSIETIGISALGNYAIIASGALGSASSALLSSVFNGANFFQTAKNTLSGAFWGAASSIMNFDIGKIQNTAMRYLAHTVTEGAVEAMQGGSFIHGAFVGGLSTIGNSYIDGMKDIEDPYKIAASAVWGGVISELGGGKFANGALSSAFIMMYNDLLHKIYVRQNKKTIVAAVPLDTKVGVQYMLINIDANIIEKYDCKRNSLSMEVIVTSYNSTCYAGDVVGTFEATLDVDGKETKLSLKQYKNALVTGKSCNFSGNAIFKNINYSSAKCIYTKIYGNWNVNTGQGFHLVTYPTIIGLFFPRSYKHKFKIK